MQGHHPCNIFGFNIGASAKQDASYILLAAMSSHGQCRSSGHRGSGLNMSTLVKTMLNFLMATILHGFDESRQILLFEVYASVYIILRSNSSAS
jgi:hypothetical protein